MYRSQQIRSALIDVPLRYECLASSTVRVGRIHAFRFSNPSSPSPTIVSITVRAPSTNHPNCSSKEFTATLTSPTLWSGRGSDGSSLGLLLNGSTHDLQSQIDMMPLLPPDPDPIALLVQRSNSLVVSP